MNKITFQNAFLKFNQLDNNIIIEEISFQTIEELKLLIDRLVITNYLKLKDLKQILYYGDKDLTLYNFKKENSFYFLNCDKIKIRRFVQIGDGATGKLNNICDVKGVMVGQFTLNLDDYHTGITVIKPHPGNVFKEKVVASCYSFNGFGKSVGLVQVEELGTIETNVVFTTTMNVGKVMDGVIEDALNNNLEIGVSTGTVNSLVMECNDGGLNKSRDRILEKNDYFKALDNLNTDFVQGDVGAGMGMVCHGFKGGIGSSSRIIEINGKKYTLAIIVNSNFGSSNGLDLIFKGRALGDKIKAYNEQSEDKGSIVACLVTDLPLSDRQIRRLLKRVEIGIGRTGSYAGNGSGDVFVGFSTANKVNHFVDSPIDNIERFSDNYINTVFKRTVEATEEAVLNSMLFSHPLKGYLKEMKSLMEYFDLFSDLLNEVVEYEI